MNVWTAARNTRQQERIRRLIDKAGEEEYQQLEAKRKKDSREADKKAKEETKKVKKDSGEAEREAEKEKAPTEENLEENSGGKWTEVQRSRRSREKDSREAEDKAKKSDNEAGIPGLHFLSAERDRQSANFYSLVECNPGKID